jgi:hypothetical protein
MNIFNKKEPIEPIKFFNKDEEFRPNAISFFDVDLNGQQRFAITRTTENGKYLRGNTLFYSLNGVEIYAELSDAIYVDLVNKTAMVKKFSKAEDESNTRKVC